MANAIAVGPSAAYMYSICRSEQILKHTCLYKLTIKALFDGQLIKYKPSMSTLEKQFMRWLLLKIVSVLGFFQIAAIN